MNVLPIIWFFIGPPLIGIVVLVGASAIAYYIRERINSRDDK